MSGAGKVVCVTGASGYIASWLVKLLLDRGYTVKATVRSLNDPKKTEHLLALGGAKERLHLFEANLVEEESFDSAIDGCDGVFHTASPVYLSVTDPQAELIDPAVKGTLNVLRSCAKVSSVKRVVVTSSMASVISNNKPLKPDVVIDEIWYSDAEFCEQTKAWYPLSKTLAEEAAWKFGKENGIDMVMINPGFVIGPCLQPTLNLTSEAILNLVKSGREVFSNGIYRYVDVRDVACAHIKAFEIPSASGRYCLVGTVTYSAEALKILHKLYPALNLPQKCEEEKPVSPPYQVSKERAKSLGIDFIPRVEPQGHNCRLEREVVFELLNYIPREQYHLQSNASLYLGVSPHFRLCMSRNFVPKHLQVNLTLFISSFIIKKRYLILEPAFL